jgi:hypothetical protein
MKTHMTTLLAMGLIYMMSLLLFGCTQYSPAAKMDTSTEGTMTETTEHSMGNTIKTMKDKNMKGDMGEMGGQNMKATKDTMKSETMKNTMDSTKDTMMHDNGSEMMK